MGTECFVECVLVRFEFGWVAGVSFKMCIGEPRIKMVELFKLECIFLNVPWMPSQIFLIMESFVECGLVRCRLGWVGFLSVRDWGNGYSKSSSFNLVA